MPHIFNSFLCKWDNFNICEFPNTNNPFLALVKATLTLFVLAKNYPFLINGSDLTVDTII